LTSPPAPAAQAQLQLRRKRRKRRKKMSRMKAKRRRQRRKEQPSLMRGPELSLRKSTLSQVGCASAVSTLSPRFVCK